MLIRVFITQEYKVYPFAVKYFSDDLRVISSLVEDKYILGKRLVKIGQTNIKTVEKLIGETVSTENEFWLKYRLPQVDRSSRFIAGNRNSNGY